MTRRHADPAHIDVTDLRPYLPAIYAGARALRERQRWAARVALLPLTATEAAKDAEALEQLAERLDSAGPAP